MISFSGYDWEVRSGTGGPGPNDWSADNVFVDADGLHLKISNSGSTWSCAEVTLTQRLGFGVYEFQLTGRPDLFDRNVVLGLFNYPPADVGPDGTNEIDIEFAQWGQAGNRNRLNWTVYPPALGPGTTHNEVPLEVSLEFLLTVERIAKNPIPERKFNDPTRSFYWDANSGYRGYAVNVADYSITFFTYYFSSVFYLTGSPWCILLYVYIG